MGQPRGVPGLWTTNVGSQSFDGPERAAAGVYLVVTLYTTARRSQ